jgi:hypothetical protein
VRFFDDDVLLSRDQLSMRKRLAQLERIDLQLGSKALDMRNEARKKAEDAGGDIRNCDVRGADRKEFVRALRKSDRAREICTRPVPIPLENRNQRFELRVSGAGTESAYARVQ